MSDKTYKVYVHISPSNKYYVGITSQSVKKRWLGGYGYCKNPHFTRAIEKYGWDSFQHIVFEDGLSKEQAEDIEKALIEKYQSNNKLFGYNIKSGGDSNGKHSEESKELMSINRKGKGRQKKSEETIRRMKANHKGGAKPKTVMCVETGKIYESINKAAEDVGLTKKMISCCCRNVKHYNTAGGYHWQFI